MRERDIKPGFFTNPQIIKLTFAARLLFIGLWCLADREGRLEDNPGRIKLELFPDQKMDVEGCLKQLETSDERFITRYEVDGKRYIQIEKFSKHQHPHPNEAASRIPEPLENDHISTNGISTSTNGISQSSKGERARAGFQAFGTYNLAGGSNAHAREAFADNLTMLKGGQLTPMDIDLLTGALEDLGDEAVEYALQTTETEQPLKPIAFFERVTQSLRARGVKDAETLEAYKTWFAAKKQGRKRSGNIFLDMAIEEERKERELGIVPVPQDDGPLDAAEILEGARLIHERRHGYHDEQRSEVTHRDDQKLLP